MLLLSDRLLLLRSSQFTPLMRAAQKRHHEALDLLIVAGPTSTRPAPAG